MNDTCPLCDDTGLIEDPSACNDPDHCYGWMPCPNGCPEPTDVDTLTDAELSREIGRMALDRALTPRGPREIAFLNELHTRHPGLCRCPDRYLPHDV